MGEMLYAIFHKYVEVELVEPPGSAHVGERVAFTTNCDGIPDEILKSKIRSWKLCKSISHAVVDLLVNLSHHEFD
ncbi:hypothetical protein Lal_00014032 [Lupinus albus]|nr:hypothetical protein Lal_00014032 [Lupinus albus]